MVFKNYILLTIGLLIGLMATNAQVPPANMSSGDWFKLSIETTGVYKIDHNFLKKLGIDPSQIDPREIKIFGNKGGMLPQFNAVDRPELWENAIFVSGEDDGVFDASDFVIFYAEGSDKVEFDVQKGVFSYEQNLYSDLNFYFLVLTEGPGRRIQTFPDAGAGYPLVTTFNDCAYYENDNYNDQKSGREWFGEKFGVSTNEHTITFPIDGISNTSPITVVSSVLGQSHTNASFKVLMNDVPIGEHAVFPIPNTRYGVKGIHRRDTFSIEVSSVNASGRTDQQIKYQFTKGTGHSQGYLDFVLLNFERELKLYNKQTIFLSNASRQNAISQFQIASATDNIRIWDVTDPYNIGEQSFTHANDLATFATATNQLKKFIIFNSEANAPGIVGRVESQNLNGMTPVNLIIVTHPLFKDEAQRLATHRESFSNWSVAVVTTEEIYNEYASGRQDVSAIRDFVRDVYRKSPSTLKALLLMGKGSYDYKDRIPNNKNFVITYESRSSLHPLQTFSSDDYFGFLEDDEGQWAESPAQNHTLDIGVGRLPVTSVEEARNVVDKIIDYETNKNAFGYWRKRIAFVADDGNNEDGYTTLHQSQADQLSVYTEETGDGIDPRKLFMGTYQKDIRPNGESIPQFTEDLIRTFELGSVIINYTGHGSEVQWGDENVFNDHTIEELENKLYPFLVTATCEFGRQDDPSRISSAELAVTAKKTGAIGLVTTARPVNATTNFNLNHAFYEALFQREGDNFLSIGEVFRHTKNNSTSGVANRNFSLLSDPSLTLALPPHVAQITHLKTATGSDTLKAMSTVIVKGEITTFTGEKLTSFNGVVTATLFDKVTPLSTIGKNDPAFTYEQWDNALFRGEATVTSGEFEFEFILPKNISYTVSYGKFSLYAADTSTLKDAMGSLSDFRVGETETGVIAEGNSPAIRLFMGDTTFVNGGIITPDTYLIAHLDDESGINISNYGIGNSIMADLDNGSETFLLNDYYVASKDDASSGWVRFPLKGLAPGRHTLTLRAWDVFNNGAESTIEFIVTDGENLVIESFGNYPNPFEGHTNLFFTHNRSGDDLQAQLFIQSTAGELIKSFEFMLPGSDYRVDLIALTSPEHFGKKLPPGLYLARLIVRSLTNGSKNEQVTKLIMLN